MTPDVSPVVSQQLVERFTKAFADFVNEVTKAVLEARLNPALSSAPALLMWQTKALPLLEKHDAAIQNALALYQIGEARTMLTLAADKRGLAKDLEGFPHDFAGPQHVNKLESLETAVVVAAYQLCAAAGIP